MNNLPENLKNLRIENKITQQEIADYIHKTKATYCRYEKGTLKPDIDTLILIADMYKVSLDYLTGRYK